MPMSVPIRHVLQQGPVLAALVRAGVAAARSGSGGEPPDTPTADLMATVAGPGKDLIADYIAHVGGSPSAWKGQIPPHLFPQWGFPLLSRTLEGVPYNLSKVLNGGCRIEVNAPLPAGEPLTLKARLQDIDDDGRRAVLHQQIVTGTASNPEALVCSVYAIVPLKRDKGERREKKPKPHIPVDAREVARWSLPAGAGRDFAVLTGDFNPIHWIPAAGRMAGFGGCILHGFATLARAWEGVVAARHVGNVSKMRTLDVRFVKPLRIPGDVGLYLADDNTFFVGNAPGAPACMTGSFTEDVPHE